MGSELSKLFVMVFSIIHIHWDFSKNIPYLLTDFNVAVRIYQVYSLPLCRPKNVSSLFTEKKTLNKPIKKNYSSNEQSILNNQLKKISTHLTSVRYSNYLEPVYIAIDFSSYPCYSHHC